MEASNLSRSFAGGILNYICMADELVLVSVAVSAYMDTVDS